jgi:methanogenic corrinoid protein MtbC1
MIGYSLKLFRIEERPMSNTVLEDLKRAILTYNQDLAQELAKKIREEKTDPLAALNVMTEAIREIGEGFRKGDLYLPDLVGGSSAMLSAMPIIEEEIKRSGKDKGETITVVVGTVYGDIHSIGKTMVSTLLIAGGFTVHDIGVNIKPDEFVNAVKKYNADILAMSALMTMTAPQQKRTIEALVREGLRKKVKVMVGGSAITEEFADSIGADGYDSTAPGAVELAKKLIGP